MGRPVPTALTCANTNCFTHHQPERFEPQSESAGDPATPIKPGYSFGRRVLITAEINHSTQFVHRVSHLPIHGLCVGVIGNVRI